MKTCGIARQWDTELIREAEKAGVLVNWELGTKLGSLITKDGVEGFVVSMDQGGGLLAAELIALLKEPRQFVRLVCVLRWKEQAVGWPEHVRDQWFKVFADCDEEVMLEHHRSSENLIKRDRLLLERCDRLLLLRNSELDFAWGLAERAKQKGIPVSELVI